MVTCSDCLEEWDGYCPLCKNSKPTVLKKRILSKKSKPKKLVSESEKKKKRKIFLRSKQQERDYWLQFHPKRVVSLIMRGHDASCVCCYRLITLTFDHIIPISKGGENALKNGQILCTECNGIKDDLIISIEDLRNKVELARMVKDFNSRK